MPYVNRRAFLRTTSSAAALALTAPAWADQRPGAQRCILLMLVGGPSHLDTLDPKPDAPADVRGPFASIATSVPGVRLGEHLPRTASLAHRYTIFRSVHHDRAPVHEAGLQLLQTGRLSQDGAPAPHLGELLAQQCPGASVPAFVLLPGPVGNLGLNVDCGQGAAQRWQQTLPVEPDSARDRFGRSDFGAACLQACRLAERGVRCVTVNMFDRLADRVTWDCHAAGPSLPSTLDDYRRTLCPIFDRAFSALLQELHERGLLETTLVAVLSEFGRTPRLNERGGRDHWPGAWSIVMAGGGMAGGQVVGATDRHGAEPVDRPVPAAGVFAALCQALGVERTELPASQPVLHAAWKL